MRTDGFDRWADTYDQDVHRDDRLGLFPFIGYRQMQDTLFEKIRTNKVRTLLDVGVGTGEFAARMIDAGVSVTGIDLSEKMLENAKRRAPGIHALPHDLRGGLPEALLGQSFDGIVCAYVVHHFPDEQKIRLIRSLFSMLAPGGLLLVGDISFQDENARAACELLNAESWDPDEFYYVDDPVRRRIGIPCDYQQLSECAGILTIRKPAMVLFDFEGALFQEAPFHNERGIKALLAHAKDSPNAYTAKEISACYAQLEKSVSDIRKRSQIDISHTVLRRVLFERLGIGFSLTELEMESVFFENAYQGKMNDGAGPLLELLDAKGIRTGIICNSSFRGETLGMHIRSMPLKHRFEMIITSGDYLFQKPNLTLFEIALQKANLEPCEIWYCGSDFGIDIKGACMSGMCPVWYAKGGTEAIAPAKLCINHLDELTQIFR